MSFCYFTLAIALLFHVSTFVRAETNPPLKPAPQHRIISGKLEYTDAGGPCAAKAPKLTPLPQAQIDTEFKVTQAVFQVEFQQTREPYFEVSATAFQIAPDLVITNRHVLEQLLGPISLQDPKAGEEIGRKVRSMQFHSSIPELTFHPEKLLYCSESTDFCILKLARQGEGISAGSLLPSLKLKASEFTQTNPKGNPTIVGIVGNMNGHGIQGASDRLIRVQNTGLLLHCVPTSTHESGGNSGSPIFDQNGEVIGIDTYSLALDSGCKGRSRTTGGGISSEALLHDLKQNEIELYETLSAN